ncbi:hypothetical protein SDRG_08226 [Saprolegnia diclina VS20]|uniref:Uncharacterized protein n=1 Tax=Saprolegnia diclina (strain VS20) TaxID=1156394 RepID=T0Q835_SAPDV|nr:hypothetical protein SDRG_08226 [Saprolegnia diclina VS20]EQC34009.1 hypothetical protein SDRG_08226 [Saprolegnia diclina VS20]|eukprot:XP_008612321.1 hypothetical protein SDRG_08226 [Saprolegnia diclina VS20]
MPLSFTFDRKRLQALQPTITAVAAAVAKDKKKRAAKASIDPHKRPRTNKKPETPQDMRKTNKGKSKKKLQSPRPQSHPPSDPDAPEPEPRKEKTKTKPTSPHMSTNANEVNPSTRDDAAAPLFDQEQSYMPSHDETSASLQPGAYVNDDTIQLLIKLAIQKHSAGDDTVGYIAPHHFKAYSDDATEWLTRFTSNDR